VSQKAKTIKTHTNIAPSFIKHLVLHKDIKDPSFAMLPHPAENGFRRASKVSRQTLNAAPARHLRLNDGMR
jgi:hypothetical protein